MREQLRKQIDFNGPNGCWIWRGKPNKRYGLVSFKKKRMRAHRAVWEDSFGPLLPYPKQVLHHRCENKSCVNPAHLEPMTQKENILHSKHCPTCTCKRIQPPQCQWQHPFMVRRDPRSDSWWWLNDKFCVKFKTTKMTLDNYVIC